MNNEFVKGWTNIYDSSLKVMSYFLNNVFLGIGDCIWHADFHAGTALSVNSNGQAELESEELSDRWYEFEWLNNEIKCYLGWHYKYKDTLEEENVVSD